MSNLVNIRTRLGLTQASLAAAIRVSQSNVCHYERGHQKIPSDVAGRIIAAAASLGVTVSFDEIYAPPPAEVMAPEGAQAHG